MRSSVPKSKTRGEDGEVKVEGIYSGGLGTEELGVTCGDGEVQTRYLGKLA